MTEDAWVWIDKEDNIEILGLVIKFLLIASDEQEFSDFRRAALENRVLHRRYYD